MGLVGSTVSEARHVGPRLLNHRSVEPQRILIVSLVSVENLVSTWTVFCKANLIITETLYTFILKSQKRGYVYTFVKALFIVFP